VIVVSQHRRIVLLLLSVAVLSSGCERRASELGAAPEAAGSRANEKPSILLVTLDTTRADRLGIENDQVRTPELTALAARGLYFEQAYATTPTTLPSHTSMLTGLYPTEHGIRENGSRVCEELDLLPKLLQSRGFSTAAFVSGFPLASRFGLARGFDHFEY